MTLLQWVALRDRYHGTYPTRGQDGHDLVLLSRLSFGKENVSIVSIAREKGEMRLLAEGLSHWNMSCRYLLKDDIEDMKCAATT